MFKAKGKNHLKEDTMKKLRIGILAVVLALAIPGVALAAGYGKGGQDMRGAYAGAADQATAVEAQAESVQADDTATTQVGRGAGYIDENGDGVCDNYGTGAGCVGFVDANGDGVCDNCGATSGTGCGHFVDANGDGICDNHGTGCGHGHGGGCGGNFVDADGDGVCDNFGTGAGCGQGNGYGNGRGHHGGGHHGWR